MLPIYTFVQARRDGTIGYPQGCSLRHAVPGRKILLLTRVVSGAILIARQYVGARGVYKQPAVHVRE